MTSETSKAVDAVNSDIMASRGAAEALAASGVYTFKCYDADGNLKWEAVAPNKVTNVGVQDMNTKYFTGSAYTGAFYLGLINGPGAGNTYNFTDTMSSHTGWTESASYSQVNRPTCSFGAPTNANPSVATNSLSTATFSINGTATIAGAFLTTSNAKSGTSGTLFSAANFQSPGDRSVVNGDTLVVTYTFSLTAT
jgi:hypothetical protein